MNSNNKNNSNYKKKYINYKKKYIINYLRKIYKKKVDEDIIYEIQTKLLKNNEISNEISLDLTESKNILKSEKASLIIFHYLKKLQDRNTFYEKLPKLFLQKINDPNYLDIINGLYNKIKKLHNNFISYFDLTDILIYKWNSKDFFSEMLYGLDDVGTCLYFLSERKKNKETVSILNKFYEFVPPSNILWGLGTDEKSLMDINLHLEFFENSKDDFEWLYNEVEGDDDNNKVKHILLSIIFNIVIEASYQANHLELQQEKNINTLFKKLEIISFFNCPKCNSKIKANNSSYNDGTCTNCQQHFEQKNIEIHLDNYKFYGIFNGGKLSEENFNKIKDNKPMILLIIPIPNNIERNIIILDDNSYNIEVKNEWNYNLKKSKIILNKDVNLTENTYKINFDSTLKMLQKITEENEEYSTRFNSIITNLFDTLKKRWNFNKTIFDDFYTDRIKNHLTNNIKLAIDSFEMNLYDIINYLTNLLKKNLIEDTNKISNHI